jgi:hypothetical protein
MNVYRINSKKHIKKSFWCEIGIHKYVYDYNIFYKKNNINESHWLIRCQCMRLGCDKIKQKITYDVSYFE